ncbi:hypothetical protein DICVIV_11818 [Dictyocaulus viviparus]|uniref:Uncharacterized protein n=1 Tax=Dictyocaulus viviparus TaxID=29172 RepID=A0A0D8XEV1_DICVI|nr:hypothetical protein DICVIV_11818 [Dictyocaulus viviparus]
MGRNGTSRITETQYFADFIVHVTFREAKLLRHERCKIIENCIFIGSATVKVGNESLELEDEEKDNFPI